MANPIEDGGGQYDVQRALHHHERITTILKSKAAAGDIHLLTEIPVSGLTVFGIEPTHVIAPTQPVHTAREMDRFRQSLLPGITPDFQTNSTGSYADTHGGLYFGSLSYDNVPGFTLYEGRVTQDPHLYSKADWQALERLSKETKKQKTELVRRTWVRTLPEVTFAQFMFDYAKGLKDGSYPYSPLFFHLESGLNERRLQALQENPQRFVDWLGQQVEVARTYTGITSNLALAQP